jgi:hypothetical protein
MPTHRQLLASASLFLLTIAAAAQGTKPARCSAQPPQPPTDASRAFAAGDAAKAESLYKAQLATSGAYPAFAGLVAAQLQLNQLPEALETAKHAASALPRPMRKPWSATFTSAPARSPKPPTPTPRPPSSIPAPRAPSTE